MKKIIQFSLVCRGIAYSSLIECSSAIVLLLEVLSVRAFSLFFSLHCFQMFSGTEMKRRPDILATSVSSDLQLQKNGNSLHL